jgi:tRNA nucleotidyltransferase/poly(A) polymerase
VLLPAAAAERIRDEFIHILDLPHPGIALRLMDQLRLLAAVLPELEALRELRQPPPHEYLGLDHTLAVADRLGEILDVRSAAGEVSRAGDFIRARVASELEPFREEVVLHLRQQPTSGRNQRELLFLAALMHDVGKPECRQENADGRIRFIGHERASAELAAKRGSALRLSNTEIKSLSSVVLHHMWPGALQSSGVPPTPRATYRFWRENGPDGISVILLSLADLLGMRPLPPDEAAWSPRLEVASALLRGYLETLPALLSGPPLVRGEDLMENLRQPPGPLIGRLLEFVREAQAAGDIKNREDALALVRRVVAERGTDPSAWDRTTEAEP